MEDEQNLKLLRLSVDNASNFERLVLHSSWMLTCTFPLPGSSQSCSSFAKS